MIVVARIGPIAPPTFLSIVFKPSPVVLLSGGTETEIMLTIGLIIAIAAHDEEIKQSLKSEYEKDADLLKELLQKQIDSGKMATKIDAETLAQLFIALYVGMAMKVIMGDDSVEIHKAWSNAIGAMINQKPA
jgi:hypothetical protein